MKRTIFFVLGLIFVSARLVAQTDNKTEIIVNNSSAESLNISTQQIGIGGQVSRQPMLPTFDTPQVSNLNYNIVFGKSNTGGIFPISNRFFISLESEQKNSVNLFGYNLAYAALGWRLNKHVAISGGLMELQRFDFKSTRVAADYGVKFEFKYTVTQNFAINLWGQYLSDNYRGAPTYFLLPRSGTGVSATLHFGEAQLGVEAAYQYNERDLLWDYQCGGKLKLSF